MITISKQLDALLNDMQVLHNKKKLTVSEGKLIFDLVSEAKWKLFAAINRIS